jgi:Xaa-Pro aminopeptidase
MESTRSTHRKASPPALTFAERDRRWAHTRELMTQAGLEVLLVGGFRAREMYESYLSDDYNEGCVIFPLQGAPVVVTWAPLRVKRAQYSTEQGHALWIEDMRVAASGKAVGELVAELGLARSMMGVVGLRSIAPTEQYGSIPAAFWMDFCSALPDLQYQDFSEEFSHLMLVKSHEEIQQMRYAAQAAESACRVIAELAEPGVGEEVIFSQAVAEMLSFGIGVRYPMIVMNSGPQTLSWGPPRWTTRGEMPRVLQRGDLLQAELMPLCGNQEAQVQMTVALDPMDETSRRCESVALASYEAGLMALKPGMTFAELVSAMESPLREHGCWGYTPLVHSVAPHFLAGSTLVNREQVNLNVRLAGPPRSIQRQRVIEPGMVFAFEPNACIGQHRVNIGGTVLVTDSGCEPLNDLPTRVTHK